MQDNIKVFLFRVGSFFIWAFKTLFIIILGVTILIFTLDIMRSLPFYAKDPSLPPLDPIALSNTYIVYVTFIAVIGTVGLTLAGFFFQKSMARNEKIILHDNLEKVIQAIEKDDGAYRNELLDKLFDSRKTKALLEKELDDRIRLSIANLNHLLSTKYEEKITVLEAEIRKIGNDISKRNNFTVNDGDDDKVSNIILDMPNNSTTKDA